MPRRTLVLITGLSLSACAGAPPPQPEVVQISRNPPALPMRATSQEVLTGEPVTGTFPTLLNPRDSRFGVVHASADGGCHVYPSTDKVLAPGQRPPSQSIKCPHSLLAPQWSHCAGDAVMYASDTGESCVCRPSGNPPPPSFIVPCPPHG